MPLHINVKDLITGKTVESDRIEYKKGWNPGAIYRSICAFANDFDDIGGGYIIVGIEEKNGRPVLPPYGVDEEEIDQIQKEMLGYNNLINPAYHAKVNIEEIDGKKIIVIWALSGFNRPYEVPEEIKAKDKKYHYYIRLMSNTVRANKEQREELISLSNKVPFDDRANTTADVNEISFTLLKEFLRQTESQLLEWVDDHSKTDILSQMQLLYGPPELLHPRNVALMLFTDNIEKYFPYHRDYQTREPVEIRIYPDHMVFLNYGGPDRNIKLSAFKTGPILPRKYRNRRLGDFLKELDLTEGKATGIPIIRKSLKSNGSPEAVFDTDEDRSYFQVILPIHPDFLRPIEEDVAGRNGGLNGGLNGLFAMIKTFPGQKAVFYGNKMSVPARTIERWLAILKKDNRIEYRGARKTGGYWTLE